MKVSVIKYSYEASDDDPCRGVRTWKETMRAILIQSSAVGAPTVIAVQRWGATYFFNVEKKKDGSFCYTPDPDILLDAILPRNSDFEVVEDLAVSDFAYDVIRIAQSLPRLVELKRHFGKLLSRTNRGESLLVPPKEKVGEGVF